MHILRSPLKVRRILQKSSKTAFRNWSRKRWSKFALWDVLLPFNNLPFMNQTVSSDPLVVLAGAP